MRYVILILSLVITTNCVAQTKHPKTKKSVKTTKAIITDSTANIAVKAAMDSLRVHGCLKD
jgi:hypothetical protein